MSKLTEALRAIKIYNLYGIVKHRHPYISVGAARPRACIGKSVLLHIKDYKFKDAAWYDNGCLSFPYSDTKGRRAAVQKAIDRAKKIFPEIELVKGPWPMTWVPKCDLEDAKKRIKEKGDANA